MKHKYKVVEFQAGDQILLEGKWRTFSLATPSITRPGQINIVVSDTSRRFFRADANAMFERKPVKA